MKVLITYSTLTGNTKKIANSVKDAIQNADLLDISEVNTLDYDLIIIGTWIDKGSADNKALNFIKTIKNKKTAFFFTLGAYANSEHSKNCNNKITEILKENNNEVIGSFHCQGAIDPKLIEQMKKMFPADHHHGANPESLKRWGDASTHPDVNDERNAKEYFENLIKKLG
ncbi:MAG: flavodoxin family protein [Fusobacteriaceae bacterium]|jgi:flavodoxin|nr:flavodoxin family protein [Fusobacteriaceae bacterium]